MLYSLLSPFSLEYLRAGIAYFHEETTFHEPRRWSQTKGTTASKEETEVNDIDIGKTATPCK
jgi:hypothetical protein